LSSFFNEILQRGQIRTIGGALPNNTMCANPGAAAIEVPMRQERLGVKAFSSEKSTDPNGSSLKEDSHDTTH
jgi:hypothetical protein